MKKTFLSLVILGLFLTGPVVGSVHALQIIDVPIPTGSWSQVFKEHSVGPFDSLKVDMVSDDSFKEPVFQYFDVSGWTGTNLTPQQATASGSAVETLLFSLHFDGDLKNPLAFEFRAFDGGLDGVIRESARLEWSGSTWDITYNYDNPHCIAPVPIPGALLLLGAGLTRLGAYARRRRD
jgi:hypothetical protein